MRQILLIVAIFVSAIVNAGPVSKEEAQQKAAQFMTAKTGIQKTLKITPSGARRAISAQQEPFYVFNFEGGGFVIVSGEDRTDDVLGYSLSGTFDSKTIPNNMRAFLQQYADDIQYLIDNNVQLSTNNKRAMRRASEKTPIEPLLETFWGQEAPYNALCPEANGYRTFTGCVATAMAQIMYYHQWPEAITATIPAYQTKKYEINMDEIPAGTPIDWELMQKFYNTKYNATPAEDAVAQLMQICGQSVEMDYGLQVDGGSSASSYSAYNALVNYFDYEEQTIRLISRNNYSYNDWQDLIYQEIKENRPVFYSGLSSGGGHAFVCDGYDTDDFFHINWGWNGQSDTYFKLNMVNPYEQGAGGSSSLDGFSKQQQAIIGIQKNDGAKVDMRRLTTNVFSTEANRSYTREQKEADVTVSFNVERYNWTNEPAIFKAGYRIIDSDGNAVGNDITDSNLSKFLDVNYGWNNSVDISFGAGLEDGDYHIIPVSCVTGDMMADVNGEESYVAFNVSDNEFTITYTAEDPELQLLSHNIDGVKEAGAPLTITLDVKNIGGAIHDDVYVDVYYSETDADPDTKEAIGYFPISFLELAKNESTQIEINYKPKTAGVYYLSIINKNHKKLGANVEVAIDPSTAPLLSLEEMLMPDVEAEEGQSYVNGDKFTITLKIKNEGVSTYKGKLIGRYKGFSPDYGSFINLNGIGINEDMTIEPGDTIVKVVQMENLAPRFSIPITLQRIEFFYTQYETEEVELDMTPNIEYRVPKLQVVNEIVENPGEEGGDTFTGDTFVLNFDISNIGFGAFNKNIGASIWWLVGDTWTWKGYVEAVKQVEIKAEETETVQFSFNIARYLENSEKFKILLFREADEGGYYSMHESRIYTHVEAKAYTPGDANGDGEINITDITYIIDKINNKPSDDFEEKAADLNEDGEINITDVTLLLDIINQAQ